MKARAPIVIVIATVVVIVIAVLLVVRAESKQNQITLASLPKPVTITLAREASYRPTRMYVGTIRPWALADVGPQLVAAYVDTVLVRPGAIVRRNEVLATLDCKSESAATQAIASQARAIDARQKAVAHEAARTQTLLDGGFVSQNEVEQKLAQSASEAAQLESQRASLAQSALQVNDCILRAPFDGEIGQREMDPGAFARPGVTLVTVVDRSTIRVTVDVPENEFEALKVGTRVKVHVVSTSQDFDATVSRTAPMADPGTRTVHVEIDVADPNRTIPVNTTAEVRVDVGVPIIASEITVSAATAQNAKATFFTADGDVAHAHVVAILGEANGNFYFATKDLAPGARVVTEGRTLLADGDRVIAKVAP